MSCFFKPRGIEVWICFMKLILRLNQLGWCLVRYGVIKNTADLSAFYARKRISFLRISHSKPISFSRVLGKNLALTCQEMGPTFIKLGQLLATRSDVLPPEITQELEVLLTSVKPVALRQIKKIIHSELGKAKAIELFSEIEEKPLGSASLGQCHRATLKDGSTVVIKVQKPGVADKVELDLKLLENLITPLSYLFPQFSIKEIFYDFKEATLREIDYRLEARNIDRFKKNNRNILTGSILNGSAVVFPSYLKDALTSKVIILELMRGESFTELKKGSRIAKKAAYRSLEAVFEQIFYHGFFHADPHAANMFYIEEQGKVGFIDLGLVGELKKEDKKRFLEVLLAVLKRDRKKLSLALYRLGKPGPETQLDQFQKEIDSLLDEVKTLGIENLPLQKIVQRLFEIARANNITIPNRYILMVRSCLLIEGVAKKLDPDISLVRVALPIVTKGFLSSLIKSAG